MVTRIGPSKPVRLFIKKRRLKQHLTLEQLALRVGTTAASISRWENQDRDITTGALAAVADALGCRAMDLFIDPDRPSADELMRDMDGPTREQAIRLLTALKG